MDVIQQRLKSALKTLEDADLDAIRTKRRADRILGVDFQDGVEIILVYAWFSIDGVEYRARITPQQRDLIAYTAANGSAQQVLDLITDNILANHMFAGAIAVLNTLITALTNQDLGTLARATTDREDKKILAGGPVKLGGCAFNGTCKNNFSPTLCECQGGTVLPACPPTDVHAAKSKKKH